MKTKSSPLCPVLPLFLNENSDLEWMELMSNIARYEGVIFRASGRHDVFMITWGPFLSLTESVV